MSNSFWYFAPAFPTWLSVSQLRRFCPYVPDSMYVKFYIEIKGIYQLLAKDGCFPKFPGLPI